MLLFIADFVAGASEPSSISIRSHLAKPKKATFADLHPVWVSPWCQCLAVNDFLELLCHNFSSMKKV